ncbi:LysR substrate-binding domain-containing protein [Ornithinimicrobium murale]|uniref:LysR substrate-binding domain-containing protein n=1 Tax=Ornithinimicrobium murale TaxID=1050153 RepID=UPI000E0DB43B|nr:LysR substrate-binding domain-containing protein [Ornithinimicrobium murale]
MIDPRLQVLRVVAARGTVTAAAHDLSYTPSAVSHQLRGLARDLGVTLLEPDGRGVRLTAAARVLLERADELYARWEEIHAEVAEADPEAAGAVRLCGFSTAAAALLPSVAARVRAAHPRSTVRIIEADPTECFELLLAEQADLAVVVAVPGLPSTTDPRFEQESVLDDPLDLLVPTDHPLATRSSVLLREAADESWILDRPGSPFHQLTQTACATAGFSPFVAHEAAEWETGAALVDAGLGVGLVPRLARLPGGYRITRVPLRGDPTPARHIRSSIRRGSRRQPALATALTALAEAARRSSAPGRTDWQI